MSNPEQPTDQNKTQGTDLKSWIIEHTKEITISVVSTVVGGILLLIVGVWYQQKEPKLTYTRMTAQPYNGPPINASTYTCVFSNTGNKEVDEVIAVFRLPRAKITRHQLQAEPETLSPTKVEVKGEVLTARYASMNQGAKITLSVVVESSDILPSLPKFYVDGKGVTGVEKREQDAIESELRRSKLNAYILLGMLIACVYVIKNQTDKHYAQIKDLSDEWSRKFETSLNDVMQEYTNTIEDGRKQFLNLEKMLHESIDAAKESNKISNLFNEKVIESNEQFNELYARHQKLLEEFDALKSKLAQKMQNRRQAHNKSKPKVDNLSEIDGEPT